MGKAILCAQPKWWIRKLVSTTATSASCSPAAKPISTLTAFCTKPASSVFRSRKSCQLCQPYVQLSSPDTLAFLRRHPQIAEGGEVMVNWSSKHDPAPEAAPSISDSLGLRLRSTFVVSGVPIPSERSAKAVGRRRTAEQSYRRVDHHA